MKSKTNHRFRAVSAVVTALFGSLAMFPAVAQADMPIFGVSDLTDTEQNTIISPSSYSEAEIMVNQTAPAVEGVFLDTPDTYQKDSGREIRLSLNGTMPKDAVMVALDWSFEQSAMQDGFAFRIDPNQMVIPSERLDMLPAGANELQLIVVSQSLGKISKVVHRINVVEAAPPPVLRNFAYEFGAAPASYEIGSGLDIDLDVNGELPAGADLLVLAWSGTERRMVSEFAFVLNRAPWTISAEQMAKLPAGPVELQLIYRENNRSKGAKKTHAIQLSYRIPSASIQGLPASFIAGKAPAVGFSLDSPAPTGFEMIATVEPVSTGVTGFTQTLNNSSPSLRSDQLNALKPGDYRLALVTRYNNSDVARVTQSFRVDPAPVAPTVGFAASAPAELLLGSALSLNYVVNGDVTDNHELIIQAWSVAQNKAVEDFAYRTTPASGNIPAARLERLPAGEVVLQLVLRKDQTVVATADHRMMVAQPTPEPEVTPEPETPTEPTAETDPVQPATFSGQLVGAPSTYDLSVKPTISLNISNRPAGTHVDAVIQVWSIDQGRLVDSVNHILSDKNGWTLDASKLGTMPTGRVELQALIRSDYVIQQRVTKQMTVVVPEVSNPQPADETVPETNPEQPTQETEPTVPPTQPEEVTPEAPAEDPVDQPSETTPEPTVEPDLGSVTTGFSNLTPDDNAIRVSATASKADIQAALDSGKDVLFPAGATYTVSSLAIRSGGTASNPRLIGVYGQGKRPLFRVDGNGFYTSGANSISHVAFVGLDFYSYKRDYTASSYDSSRDTDKNNAIRWISPGEGLRVEDCMFSYFYISLSIPSPDNDQAKASRDTVIHRCIFERAWGLGTTGYNRSMGIYYDTPRSGKGLTLTDSVFYHNGWRPGKIRHSESHNIYLNDAYLRNVVKTAPSDPSAPNNVSGIISIAGASHGMKHHPGGLVEDSVFAHNAIGFFVSGNDSIVRRNVVLQSTDLEGTSNDPRGMGFEAFWMKRVTIEDNVFANRSSSYKGWACRSYANETVARRNTNWNWLDGQGRDFELTGSVIENSGNLSNYSNRPLTDEDRDLGSYARYINLANEAALIQQLMNRPRGEWPEKLDARNVSRYIRNGYEPLPYD